MYQRKDKDGKVIAEHATVQPTEAELHSRKLRRIADENKQREAFEAARKPKPAAAEPAPVKPATNQKPAADI